MTEQTTNRFNIRTLGLLLLPVILLVGVIYLFLNTGGGLDLQSAAPIEDLTIEKYVLSPTTIELYVRNAGPAPLTISTLIINDAVWPFSVSPSNTIPRLGMSTIHLVYPWVDGEAYAITLFTTNAVAFDVEIPVAFNTPQPSRSTFWSFALIGLYVGVIPVFLGIFWFPVLRQLGRRWMVFLMAVTAGLLIFLGLDTLIEALENAAKTPSPFQGIGLIGIGAVSTFLLLDAVSRKNTRPGRGESEKRLSLAYMIAIGIGIHNLGEGLAIGAAYNIGEIALGTFLVVGFIIQNITEGLGIIAPLLRDRPGLHTLVWLGLIGGGPAILGAWIGGFAPSPTFATLFLAVGTGAIFEVIYEVAKLIQKDTDKQPMPITIFSGVLSGMLLLWFTGLLIK
jgi:zinc transporter ZupT